MCGIVGWYGTRHIKRDPATTLTQMAAQIRHRGPDSAGGYLSETVALGAVRLAIRDRAHGDQPLADLSSRFRIAFNGEIYNDDKLRSDLKAKGHQFRTSCDTEVALAAWIEWGVEAFSRFEGGFAVAVFDRESSQLILARDRFGKRPLHWASFDGGYLFASEAKAFRAYPGWSFRWDEDSLAGLFRFWATPPDRTVFRGVNQVPPGSCLTIDSTGEKLTAFNRMNFASSPPINLDREAATAETRRLVSEAIKRRLKSDRRIGVALSGGLDSSIVLHEALSSGSDVTAFALGFNDPKFDESEVQTNLADSVGVELHQCVVTDQQIAELLPRTVEHAESPLIRSACAPMMVLAKLMQDEGVAVSLSGEGADELFLGYDLFKEVMVEAGQLPDTTSFYQGNSNHPDRRLLSAYLRSSDSGIPTEFISHKTRLRNSAFSLRALSFEASPWRDWLRWYHNHELEAPSSLEQARQFEMRSLMTGHLLSLQGDRMAMSHGIEHRSPFLDQSVADWTHRLPAPWCIDPNGNEKQILREAYRDCLPAPVADRKKRPYQAPVASMVQLEPEYLELLSSAHELKKIPVLNADFCQRLLKKVLNAAPGQTSEREERTLLLAISTALLERGFMKRKIASTHFEFEIETDLTAS